jgi:hypothetical protein
MTEEIKTKKCKICGLEKSLDDFYACSKSKDKRGSYCKLCANEYTRLRAANNPEVRAKKKKYNQEHTEQTSATRKIYRENNPKVLEDQRALYKKYPTRVLVYEAKKRAKKLGIPCTIVPEDLVIPEFCPVLGIPIIPYNTENNRDSCPSLDRINLNYGYIPENVCVMSYRANRLKNDGTLDEHDKLLKWMLEQPALLGSLES